MCIELKKHCGYHRIAQSSLMLHAGRIFTPWVAIVEARNQLARMMSRDQKQKPLAVYKLGHMRLSG